MTRRHYVLKPRQLQTTDQLIIMSNGQLFTRGDHYLWRASEVLDFLQEDDSVHLIDEQEGGLLAVDLQEHVVSSLAAELRSLRGFVLSGNAAALAQAGKANQVLDWYRQHRYCGSCGTPTQPVLEQRAVYCPLCDRHLFPRINPCIIVLVTRGRQVLLARHARSRGQFFSCLAGFIEMGENAEQTVHREVAEEVNIKVQNVRYVQSQSWPFPSQLMLGYFADYHSGEVEPDGVEIEEAGWFDIEELPVHPAAGISVAGHLIEHYAEQVRSGEF